MQGYYKVITLCGITRFNEEVIEVQKRLTSEGNIVISVSLFEHTDDKSTADFWKRELHRFGSFGR